MKNVSSVPRNSTNGGVSQRVEKAITTTSGLDYRLESAEGNYLLWQPVMEAFRKVVWEWDGTLAVQSALTRCTHKSSVLTIRNCSDVVRFTEGGEKKKKNKTLNFSGIFFPTRRPFSVPAANLESRFSCWPVPHVLTSLILALLNFLQHLLPEQKMQVEGGARLLRDLLWNKRIKDKAQGFCVLKIPIFSPPPQKKTPEKLNQHLACKSACWNPNHLVE